MCGVFDPNGIHFIPEDELKLDSEGKSSLILRFKNSTGNVIDLSNNNDEKISEYIENEAKIALSVDYRFKNQRRRTIA